MPGVTTTVLLALLGGLSLFEGLDTLPESTEERVESLAFELEPERRVLARGLEQRVQDLLAGETVDEVEVVARESLDLFAPLADRMGMARERAGLEDAAFRWLEPERYERALAAVYTSSEEDEQLLATVTQTLREQALRGGVDLAMSSRVKSLYSLDQKAVRKEVEPDSLLDRLGVRVVVPREEDCYGVLAGVRERFEEVPGSFDDYIREPKPSGYQSLHTAVWARSASGLLVPVEIQIRTSAMHQAAESGDAAHWRYKLA